MPLQDSGGCLGTGAFPLQLNLYQQCGEPWVLDVAIWDHLVESTC